LANERWRQWTPPLLIEEAPVETSLWKPGRPLVEPLITWPREVVERMRAGYQCINCLEPQEHSWPESCSLCHFPMRTKQAEFFARAYAGEAALNARNWDEELDGLEERRRKEDERARQDDQQRR